MIFNLGEIVEGNTRQTFGICKFHTASINLTYCERLGESNSSKVRFQSNIRL